MNSKGIVFFDIDGTLLDHEKELPPSTKKAVFDLKELGYEIAIATGRGPFMFEELAKELEIESFVSYNGQYVVLKGEVIYKNPLNQQALKSLTDFALTHEHPVVYMDHEDFKANVPQHDHIEESIGTLRTGKFPTYDPNYFQDRDIYQTLLFCKEGEEDLYINKFDSFDFVRWHEVSMDILPASGSKAIGIGKMIEKLGIDEDKQFAFGDGLNDIEMLRTIKHSVAMGDGHELAREAAKYVTKPVGEDGIVHGLRMIGLLGD